MSASDPDDLADRTLRRMAERGIPQGFDRSVPTSGPGWYEFITADKHATTHVAYVYDDGSVYLPEGPAVVTETDFRLASATNRFWRLMRVEVLP